MSNHSLKLRDAAAMTPAATGAAGEWVTKMGDAMRNAVSAEDVSAIMKNVVAKAKEGDPKAIQTVLDFVGRNQPRAATQLVVGVRGQSRSPNGNVNGHSPRVVEQADDDDDPPAREHVASDRTAARDIAQVLGKLGPLAVDDLTEKAGYPTAIVDRLLRINGSGTVCSWFSQNGDGAWRLTATGRKELLP